MPGLKIREEYFPHHDYDQRKGNKTIKEYAIPSISCTLNDSHMNCINGGYKAESHDSVHPHSPSILVMDIYHSQIGFNIFICMPWKSFGQYF